MYESSQIAERIKEAAKRKGISVKALLEKTELNYNMLTMMKTSFPKANTLAKIADELECSIDYLMGRTNNQEINK